MDEVLSKHGGVSYYKYSDYKLIRNCAFGSRTEALLDSDTDGDRLSDYDPRYSNIPVEKNLYFSKLRDITPEGFEVFEKIMEE